MGGSGKICVKKSILCSTLCSCFFFDGFFGFGNGKFSVRFDCVSKRNQENEKVRITHTVSLDQIEYAMSKQWAASNFVNKREWNYLNGETNKVQHLKKCQNIVAVPLQDFFLLIRSSAHLLYL